MKRNCSSSEISGRRLTLQSLALRTFCFLAVLGWLALESAPSAHAATFSREQDVTDLKLGQRVKIDDGTCPPGQVKEISGAKMTTSGVERGRKCVPRLGIKQK